MASRPAARRTAGSPELERELATYLDDEEIATVRERVAAAHQKQTNDMADIQVAAMGISDLDDDQKTRLRDLFIGKDQMSQQIRDLSELTRHREEAMKLFTDETKFEKAMRERMDPQRLRIRAIVNDQQFKQYEKYEQRMIQQAKMGIKMMSAMMKKPTKR